MPRFIFILGGGYSGLGKGIVSASIARLLLNEGLNVKIIKIDPYFNFGAGDQNPNEHGEVFVTEDGGEVDEDFGHYERITGVPCHEKQNITSGKIFWNVIAKGLKGEYLGKTIMLIPQIRDYVKESIYNAADSCDIAVIEVGGTIGDDESMIFVRAISSIIYEDGMTSAVIIVAPLIFNELVGEPKTKIAQNAVRSLNELGLKPDFMILRTQFADFLDEKRRGKLQTYCNIKKDNIFIDCDIDNIFNVPVIFFEQRMHEALLRHFNILPAVQNSNEYMAFVKKINALHERIPIAYIGKYFKEGYGIHKDAYISIEEALKRACMEHGFIPEIHRIDAERCEKDILMLKKMAGIIVPGGYGSRGFEGKIAAIKYARENNIPYLGICLGLQLGVVEFVRHVCGLENAHTDEQHDISIHPEECQYKDHHVVCILPQQEKIRAEHGFIGTQRLGDFACILKSQMMKEIYQRLSRPDDVEKKKLASYPDYRIGKINNGDFVVFERHRHRREINPQFHEMLQKHGMEFIGIHNSLDNTLLVEAATIKGKPWMATQFHPEFTSSFLQPNPFFYWFAGMAKETYKSNRFQLLDSDESI